MSGLERMTQGLAQSLVVAEQREHLDAIGREVGTPVVYLKAAWADPVLYGGKGARLGCDLDVLVQARSFTAFAAALEASGYRRRVYPRHRVTNDAFHEWTLAAPGRVPVDLHRGVAGPPWFALDPAPLIARACAYPSTDGPIVSLAPEDQVVFAAAHYATSRYRIDARHLRDTERLLALGPVDWELVLARARSAYLDVAMLLLLDALASLGCHVPRPAPTPTQAVRLRWLHSGVGAACARPRAAPRAPRLQARLDIFTVLAAVSTRPSALPHFLVEYARLRALDLASLARPTSARAASRA